MRWPRKQRDSPRAAARRTAHAWRAVRITKWDYESKKTGRAKSAVKKVVKKVGNSRKRGREALERQLTNEVPPAVFVVASFEPFGHPRFFARIG
jgi:hypothetical protein